MGALTRLSSLASVLARINPSSVCVLTWARELLQVRGIGGRLAVTIYKVWPSKQPMQLGSVRSFINNSLMSIRQHSILKKGVAWLF